MRYTKISDNNFTGTLHSQLILLAERYWGRQFCTGEACLEESDFREVRTQSHQEATFKSEGITCILGCHERDRHIEVVDSSEYNQAV